MEKKITRFIKKKFFTLTKCQIRNNEIELFLLPFFKKIFTKNFKMILISGSQGIGKSTYLELIEAIGNKFFNKKILSLSLDDFYFSKKDRLKIAKNVHPLLLTRGVPGTHDIKLLYKIINRFKRSQYPLKLPIFDKLKDDRKTKTINISKKCDILILEGWCLNCSPITKKYLYKDINLLEKKHDKNKNWRNFYNEKLKTDYFKFFQLFEYKIFFKTSSFKNVIKWRTKQEKKMKKNNHNYGMNNKEIKNFVQHYEKITKWMIKDTPKKSNLTIRINQNQKIVQIK